MDAGYVKEMERLVRAGAIVQLADGKTYSSLELRPILHEPRPEPIEVHTLNAICRYLVDNIDTVDIGKIIIHVKSPDMVSVMSNLNGETRRRDGFVFAKGDGARFPFGRWMNAEEFIIGLNSLFVQTPARDALLNFVSRVKVENESSLIDDGVSQQASVRVGIKGNLTEPAPVPSRIALRPFRTFAEVKQPESEFVFRMRNQNGEVSMSLHEADNGAWKLDAMQEVAEWIARQFTDESRPSILC